MRTIKRVVTQDKRKRTVTLRPKGTKSDYNGCRDVVGGGRTVSGSQMASKAFIIICDVELGKPHKLPEYLGRDPVRANDSLGGRGIDKKRMAACNERYRGSKFALTRKGADLSAVSCCMKGGKPVNVRYSITPKTGERLADTRRSVNGLQTGITKNGDRMIVVARYSKGCKMLERYEGKLSRTVLRRGGGRVIASSLVYGFSKTHFRI